MRITNNINRNFLKPKQVSFKGRTPTPEELLKTLYAQAKETQRQTRSLSEAVGIQTTSLNGTNGHVVSSPRSEAKSATLIDIDIVDPKIHESSSSVLSPRDSKLKLSDLSSDSELKLEDLASESKSSRPSSLSSGKASSRDLDNIIVPKIHKASSLASESKPSRPYFLPSPSNSNFSVSPRDLSSAQASNLASESKSSRPYFFAVSPSNSNFSVSPSRSSNAQASSSVLSHKSSFPILESKGTSLRSSSSSTSDLRFPNLESKPSRPSSPSSAKANPKHSSTSDLRFPSLESKHSRPSSSSSAKANPRPSSNFSVSPSDSFNSTSVEAASFELGPRSSSNLSFSQFSTVSSNDATTGNVLTPVNGTRTSTPIRDEIYDRSSSIDKNRRSSFSISNNSNASNEAKLFVRTLPVKVKRKPSLVRRVFRSLSGVFSTTR